MEATTNNGVTKVTSFSNAAKFYVGLAVALVAALASAAQQSPLTVSNVLQLAVLGLTLVAGYVAPYSPKWWKSAKAYFVTAGAILSAVIPFVAQYVDTNEWRNLTETEWVVVGLAVIKAIAMVVTTNTKPMVYDEVKPNQASVVTTLKTDTTKFEEGVAVAQSQLAPIEQRFSGTPRPVDFPLASPNPSDKDVTGNSGTGTVS